IPGTFPIRLTIMRRRLFPVRTLTALLMVMLSKLMPFTSAILSPTHRPACSAEQHSAPLDHFSISKRSGCEECPPSQLPQSGESVSSTPSSI
uniref:Uncharacterized protein n=1 Tax=Leptobrachium leishanense TaxID=445787 RepID=A0A8C5R7Y2_9ANUR